MDWRMAVLLLLLIQPASAAELRIAGELHYSSLDVTLQNMADREINFTLGFQLRKRSDSWQLVEKMPCGVNGTVGPLGSVNASCNYTTPSEPGSYKIYARADIAGGSYTYKDFLFDIGDQGFKENTQQESKKEVALSFVSSPEKVKAGEPFQLIVNVSTTKKTSLEIYSYVYLGKKCYSLRGWKGNSERHELEAGGSMVLNLTDSVSHEAAEGTYRLKVRARGSRDYDIVRDIEVEATPPDLHKKITDAGVHKDAPLDMNLFLLALAPLLALAFHRLVRRK